jgi:hypothetical protein
LCEAPAARQSLEAFARVDADDASTILSFAAFLATMPMTGSPASLEELLNDATSAIIQINQRKKIL